jgi:AmmeMemoRadiSam system protein B
MILSRLRSDLNFMPSPISGRPGLLIRDSFGYSDAILVIPPSLVGCLLFFDGVRTSQDLEAELSRLAGDEEIGNAAELLARRLSEAGFLEDEIYARLKESCRAAFAQSAVRKAAHAGKSYPADIDPLREVMGKYLGCGAASPTQAGIIGIAAPHASPEHAWQSYQSAYQCLTPDLRDRTFVVLGTSHYGAPDRFGLTRKPFETPLGRTRIDEALVSALEGQPAALMEDYCHAVEHSIEFQVVFLQSIYGPDVRILPVLCGSFGRSIDEGELPEDDDGVKRFLGALGEIAAKESKRLFWVLGIDMAHMGVRYGDKFAAQADLDEMARVAERDKLRIERVSASDPRGFWDLVKENKDDLKWCGSSPVYTFLKAVPGPQGTLHRYEQWNIDEQSMVSFAGMSFRA